MSLSINDFDSRLTRSNRRKFEEEKPERKVNVFTTKRSRKPRNKPQEVSIREGSAFMYLLEYVAEVYQMEMMVETTNIFHSDQGDDLEF